MTFARVKPDGWAVNEELSSAQMNALDIDHANAVDKTGDTITGNVHVGAGAFFTVDANGKIVVADDGIVEFRDGSLANFLTGASAVWGANSFLTVQAGGIATITNSALAISGTSVFVVGGTVDTDFNGSIDFNGTGSLGSSLLNLKSGADMRVKTGSRVYFENGASAMFDTSAGVDMLADIAFGTAHTSSYPDGSQIFHQGETSHTATSVDTYLTGAELTFETGAAVVFADGSTLLQEETSQWTCRGFVTVTPTGTFFASAGATVTFVAAPTFLGGLSATTSGTVAVSVPATFSGTTTTISSATTTFSGTTVTLSGANKRLKLTARDVIRKIPISAGNAEVVYSDGPGGYITTQSPTYIASTDTLLFQVTATAPLHTYSVPIYPPDGSVLKTIALVWTGTCNVTLNVRRNGTAIASTNSSSSGTLSVSPSVTVDCETESFCVEIVATQISGNESASVTSLKTTCTVSEYAEG
jgi:hypothetical protein